NSIRNQRNTNHWPMVYSENSAEVESIQSNEASNAMVTRKLKWSEIEKHATLTDRWIVIDNKVYDITKFQNRHPGGRKILGHFAGQDATEAFLAFHKKSSDVKKYLKPLYVGDVDPEVNDLEKTNEMKKRAAFVEDFEKLRQKMHEAGFFKTSALFFTGMLAHMFMFEVLAYLNIRYFGCGWISIMISILLYTIAQLVLSACTVSGQVVDDDAHAFEDTDYDLLLPPVTSAQVKFDRLTFFFLITFPTTKIDKDPDVRLEPVFVVGETLPVRAASKESRWSRHLPYEYQDKYFYLIGPPLLFPVYFQYTSLRHVIIRKCWEDLAWISAFYVKIFLLYYPLFGFWGTVGYFFIVRMCESHWFTWISQSNHLPMEVSYDRGEAWLPMQLRATCNVQHTLFNDWFTGHLNFQVEHHLFPTMPRHNLIKAQPYVKELCARHDIPYPVKPISVAFRDVVR
ncbi:acyl-CoA 6-desaturase (Delta-6 desaturase), partial [Paragonimus westermani]